jgi:hypothetical protein
MRITKFWFLLMAVAALALVLAGCTKEGDPVKGNVAPDTRILSYVISSAAELDSLGDPTDNYAVTVYWAGSDIDGNIKLFRYADDAGHSGESTLSQEDFVYDFSLAGSQYTLTVTAVDDKDAPDPTPAEIVIQRDAGGVETQIIDGPPHGGEVTSGVQYIVGATTPNGTISYIWHRINDGDWVQHDADDLGQATIDVTGLANGANIISFAGVRDDGTVDQTPATISVLVRAGQFAPVISNTSPVADGGGWFQGVALTFSWTVSLSHYYGSLPPLPYSVEAGAELAPPAAYNLDPDQALASGWVSEASFDYAPGAGNNTFFLKVRDLGGGVDTMRIRFGAAPFEPTKGILVVNGVHVPTYGSAITDRVDAGAYWDGFDVDFWDLFGDMGSSSGFTLPASATYVGGGSQLSPDLMAQYRTILWLGNSYQGDDAYYDLTPVYPYLQAGGNFFLATRYTSFFMPDPLTNYAEIGWRDYQQTIVEMKTVFPDLTDLQPFDAGNSLVDNFSSFGFNSGGGMVDADVTGYDGGRCFTQTGGTSTLLYAHRSSAVIGSFGYVRGLGVWAHPNLPFSDLTVAEYPEAGAASAQGNFIVLATRNYRPNITSITENFPTILELLCAEPK